MLWLTIERIKMEPFKQSDETLTALKTIKKNDKILAQYISNELDIKEIFPTKKESNLAFSKTY